MDNTDYREAYERETLKCAELVGRIADLVMNLLSVIGQFGNARKDPFLQTEYIKATSRSLVELLSYREHPIDKMHICLENDIPIVLVVGDSDVAVPYVENSKLLVDYYNANSGKITVFIKPNCGHHPHGVGASGV